MRPEKQFLTDEYAEWLNQSPFFIVTDYTGLNVAEFESLRSKLREGDAEIHVVKNSVFRAAATQAGIGDLNGALTGQIAIVVGNQEISSAAKVVKEFAEKPNKPKIRFGYVGEERLDDCLLYTSPSPRDRTRSRMPSSA